MVYEDNHLIAVNKPAGWLVQGDETGDRPLSDWVKAYIKKRYNKPGDVYLGVIHRLDRPVSGTVIFARTSKALERMNALFHDRKVEKTYYAIVLHRPDPLNDRLKHYLLKDTNTNIVKAYDRPSNRARDAKLAELDYELAGEIGKNFLLKVNPITGRPHQIRVQLSRIGCSIKGDLKYGAPKANIDGSICLHCSNLSFIHPVKNEPVSIDSEFPDTQDWHLFRGVVS